MIRDGRGFSMLEALVAVSVMLGASAAAFAMLMPAQSLMAAHLEATDVHQRARVSVDALKRDLAAAGAGPSSGAAAGPLTYFVAPVFPYRRGVRGADAPGTVRRDTITIWSVPPGLGGTTLAVEAPAQALQVRVQPQTRCPAGQSLCEFSSGDTVLLFDEWGGHELLTLTQVSASSLSVQHAGQPLSRSFAAGAVVVPVESHTYFPKFDSSSGAWQLMVYDGTFNADAPVLDHLVSLAFDYDADAAAPALRKSPADPTPPWTTYGPKPPPPGMAIAGYPPGENCTFVTEPATGQQVARLPALGPADGPLVRLSAGALSDGPWCPDAFSASRADADLLRVRRVTVVARVQAANAALRGPASSWFANPGTGAGGRMVPDFEARLTVVLRNPGLGR